MNVSLRLLLVEDSEDDADLLIRELRRGGYDPIFERVETSAAMQTALHERPWDLILADYTLPTFTAPDALDILKESGLDLPFVVVSGTIGEETAVEILIAGAHDFVLKDNLNRLIPAIKRELREAEIRRERIRIEKENKILVEQLRNCVLDGIVTIDPDTIVTNINHSAQEILEIQSDQAIGKELKEICRSGREAIAAIAGKSIASSQFIRENQITGRTKGKKWTYIIGVTPLKDHSAILVIRDITRLRSLESEVLKKYSFNNIIGKSPAIVKIFDMIDHLANTDTTVLIQGPSGSGKELIAAALHYSGARKDNPFIKVNCTALPDTLLESELFGHVKGAFTGAIRDKVGRFELANNGTIFLDEIGDISPMLQQRLLRVLQEREIERVGGTKTIKIDVRILAATNKDLAQLVSSGEFRDDLYYRLNVVPITLPSLQQRKEDISLLIQHFINQFEDHLNIVVKGIDPEAMDLLLNYPWPGNVRQLENALEHAVVLAWDGYIHLENLPPELVSFNFENNSNTPKTESVIDEQKLKELLDSVNWNRSEAARILGVNRITIWRKIQKYNLIPPK